MSERVLGKTVDRQELSDLIAVSIDSLRAHPEGQAALAKLIELSSGISHDCKELLKKIAALDRSNLEDFREDLIALVKTFNEAFLPAPLLQGRQIYADEDFTISYDAKGKLQIKQGEVAPLTLEFTQHLTSSQIDEVKVLYRDIVNPNNYNRLGLMFDFMHFFKKMRQENPSIRINEAYEIYTPDLLEIYNAYNSGNCYLTAFQMVKTLEDKGIKSQFLGKAALNEWSSLPIPGLEGSPLKSSSYTQATKNVGHAFLAIPYLDEQGNPRLVHFEVSFEENYPEEIKSFSSDRRKDIYAKYTEFSLVPNEILEPVQFAKSYLKGKSKYTLKEGDKILGVNLYTCNFYVNSKLSKLLTDAPKNVEGVISIDLSDLVDNLEKEYFIEGQKVSMNSQEALRLVIDKISQHFDLPEHFFESILFLAQSREEVHSSLLPREHLLIQRAYPRLTQIAAKLKVFEEQKHPKYFEIFDKYGDAAAYLNEGKFEEFEALLRETELELKVITN